MRTLLFSLLLTLLTADLALAGDWALKKDEDGIQVYLRHRKGSEFRSFLGRTEVDGSLSRIVAVLKDGDSITHWLKDCEQADYLSAFDPDGYLMYFRTRAPWPVQDRDYALRYRLEQDPQTLAVTLRFQGDARAAPENRECVRVTRIDGVWRLLPQPSGKIRLEYEVNADPNGRIPAWLANQFVVDQPFSTLKKLRAQLLLPPYQDAHFDFIREPGAAP